MPLSIRYNKVAALGCKSMKMKRAKLSLFTTIFSLFVITVIPAQVSVTIDTAKSSITIPANFTGFSFDPDYLTQYFSTNYNSNNSQVITQQLFNNFYPYQLPDVRFLGNNSMYWKNDSFVEPTLYNRAAGYTCTSCPTTAPNVPTSFTTTDVGYYAAFLKGLNYKPTTLFGINLGFIDPNRAVNFATYIKNTFVGYNYLFEIGNEPDLFVSTGRRLNTYTYQEEANEFNLIKKDIIPYGDAAGPTLAVIDNSDNSFWSRDIGSFIGMTSPQLKLVTMHNYPLGVNVDSLSWLSKFLSNAYTETVVTNTSSGIKLCIDTCSNYSVPFRLAEANSIAGSGTQGVSDAFGSALWVMDYMLELAHNKATGINIMTAGGTTSYYSPFIYSSTFVSTPNKVRINPIYYGMLCFARFVQNKGSLLGEPVGVNTSGANLKIWACRDSSNTTRLLIINKGISTTDESTTDITIQLDGASANATRFDLTASGGSITGNLGKTVASGASYSLAGQTVSSTTGALTGAVSSSVITPSSNTYSFSSTAATATILEIPSSALATGIDQSNLGTGFNLRCAIFPNPCESYFIVETESTTLNYTLTLYSSDGSIALPEHLYQGNQKIMLGNLAEGVYIARLSSEKGMAVKRLVVFRN